MAESFDPDEHLAAADFSVTELCERFNELFKDQLPPTIWVRGEVVKLRDHRNGHQYFDLVERDDRGQPRGTLSCSLLSWNRRGVDAMLRTRPDLFSEGTEVRIGGRPRIFAGTGRLTFEMTALDGEFTAGVKALRRAELLQALLSEGLLHRNRALPVSRLVRRVSVITSIGSAAHHDFVEELRSSGWSFELTIRNASMQGRTAAEQIADALAYCVSAEPIPDVVVIIRGGGSSSDLSSFDDERVARAIATSPVPVVVGVGHEVDQSVADEVAFRSLKTPTAAAAFFVEERNRAAALFDALRARLGALAQRSIEHPQHRLLQLEQRINTRVEDLLKRWTTEIHGYVRLLQLADPKRILDQGFAIVRTDSGSVISSVAQVTPGLVLEVEVSDGKFVAVTKERTET